MNEHQQDIVLQETLKEKSPGLLQKTAETIWI